LTLPNKSLGLSLLSLHFPFQSEAVNGGTVATRSRDDWERGTSRHILRCQVLTFSHHLTLRFLHL